MQGLSSSPAVVVRNLSKTYYLNSRGSELGLSRKSKRRKIEALKPMSMVAYPGESIGVIGKNGSGKSTLLSMIAGHLEPTSGEILVSSEPALLSVNAAFQPNQSGWRNIQLGLLAKGFSRAEVQEMQHDIGVWTELGEALERPLATYSSGQRARLQFAIATATNPEILLVDEALATGDNAFAYKAKVRMNEFLKQAGTIFVVSHAPGTIEGYCRRAIWLHEGEVIADGTAKKIGYYYRNWTKLTSHADPSHAKKYVQDIKATYAPPMIILGSEI